MPVEASDTGTTVYIDSLDPVMPLASDALRTLDNQLRLIKRAFTNTFPGLAGPVLASDVELSNLVGVATPIGPALARAGGVNWLINGDFASTATFTGTDTPTGIVAPGWELVSNKTPSELDISHIPVTVNEAVALGVPYNVEGALQLDRESTTQSTATYVFRQRIPAVRAMADRTFTLTGIFLSDVEFDVAPTLRQVFGTGGSPSAAVTVNPEAAQDPVPATSAWVTRHWTFVVPSVDAKTFGTSASSDYVELELDVPGAIDTTFSVAFTALSLVEGELVDGFDGYPEEDPHLARDRARSQYYEIPMTGAVGITGPIGNVMNLPQAVLPVRMQRPPTVTAAGMVRYVSGTSASMSNLVTEAVTVDTFQGYMTVTGTAAYSGYLLGGSLVCDARPGA